MIQETITYTCRSCGSANIVKNGKNKCGNPQYHYKDCGIYRVLHPKHQGHSPETREKVLKASLERLSQRGIGCVLDEFWSFVAKKSEKRWIWLTLSRHSRQIVAFISVGGINSPLNNFGYYPCPVCTDEYAPRLSSPTIKIILRQKAVARLRILNASVSVAFFVRI